MQPRDYNRQIDIKKDKTLGYLYFMDREHPLGSATGRVWHHRHVASVTVGYWLGQTKHVHHIDEDRANNMASNLEIVEASEHARMHRPRVAPIPCGWCGTSFQPPQNRRKFCSDACSRKHSRRFDISKEELRKLVWSLPTTKVAELLGVSDVAVGKRCKCLGIEKPPRGYWTKLQSTGL